MNKKYIVILVSFFVVNLSIQAQKNVTKEGSRLVISPDFFPINTIRVKHYSIEDSEIPTRINERITTGFRLERYSPKQAINYGVDLMVSHQNYSFFYPNEYKLNEFAINFTPFLSFKSGNEIEKIKHWFFILGLTNSYVSKPMISTFQNNIIRRYEDIPIRKYRLYGYLEVGLKKDIFYNSHWNVNKRSGLTSLSLGVSLPFFNQSYIFDYKASFFSTPFEQFEKNRTSMTGVSLKFTQVFDYRKNVNERAYIDESGTVLSSKRWKILPPIIHTLYPDSKTFGSFYLKMIYQPQLDSIFVNDQSAIFNRVGGASYELGYNYHLFSNVLNTINKSGLENGLIRDLFIGTGFSNRIYLLEGENLGRVDMFAFEGKAGARIGFKGIYLSFGYKKLFNLRERYFLNGKEVVLNEFSGLKNDIFFMGIGYKNLIYFHTNYRKIDNLKQIESKSIFDNLEFTIGIGI